MLQLFPERLNNPEYIPEYIPGWFLGVQTDAYVTNLIQNQVGEGKQIFSFMNAIIQNVEHCHLYQIQYQ